MPNVVSADDKRKYHIEKQRNAVKKTKLKKKLLEIKQNRTASKTQLNEEKVVPQQHKI